MHKNSDGLQEWHEKELVRAAQAGSDEAFSELLRRSKPRVWRVALSILGSPEEAEDALQNSNWKAYEHLAGFRQDSSFNTWLTSIVANQARMRLRELRRARLVSIDDPPEVRAAAGIADLASEGPSAEKAYSDHEMIRALHREIRRLPVQFRQILLLYVEDLSIFEAADRLGLTPAAVKTRLFRARQHLYERMRRYAEPAVAA